jgi:hypothetical protein
MFALPATAYAATIDGDLLDIHLGEQGNVQVLQFGQNSYSFYPEDETYGDAGFFIGVPGTGETYGPPIRAGSTPNEYQAVSSGSVTGAGTPASPLQQVTKYETPGVAEVTQTTTYVNGARSFRQRFDVNASASYRASVAADLYLEGSDAGVGFFNPGPPRMVGGLSEATGRAGGLREITPWSAYQELPWPDIWETVFDPSGPGFNDSIDARLIDNAIGVQWNNGGSTASYEVEWQFGLSGLTASPASALLGTGSFHEVTITATDANGNLISGGTIRYEITGANPGSGAETTAGNGQAKIGWVGNNAGTDTLTAYLDEDGNESHDPGEPQTSANAVFVAPENGPGTSEPPVLGAPPLVLQGRPIYQSGTTTLVLVVPSAGRLHVQQAFGRGTASSSAAKHHKKGKSGKKGKKGKKRRRPLVKPVTLKPKKAGPVRVKLKPTKKGKKVLAKRGKLTVKVRISFTPRGSKDTQTLVRKVTIKKHVGKKGKKKGQRGKRKSKR